MTVLLADPQITRIPAHDNGEALVDLASAGLSFDGVRDAGRHVRASLAVRLQRAQECLPAGVSLLIREGYRSPEEQERLFARYSLSLLRQTPSLDEVTLHRLTSRFVSPIAVAPHVAGAAVDLTLADETGAPLWMGTPIDATPEESANACEFAATNISEEARANRDLLGLRARAAGSGQLPHRVVALELRRSLLGRTRPARAAQSTDLSTWRLRRERADRGANRVDCPLLASTSTSMPSPPTFAPSPTPSTGRSWR